jgi:hypothetical protein
VGPSGNIRGRTGAAALALAAAALLPGLPGCHGRPAAGEKCRVPDELTCPSATRALVCTSGAWVEIPCKGAHGCSKSGDAYDCDDTVAAEGDACPLNPPLDYACTADHAKALVCKAGKFGLWRSCRGADACQVVGERSVHCDTTLGEPGDPCAQQGTYACSVDRGTMLQCDGTTLVPASSCRGPDGCRIERENRKVDCDDAVALEGDACDQPRRVACAVDHKAELVCDKNRYTKKRDCLHTDCRVESGELYCD